MGVAAIWTLITLSRPVIDGIRESFRMMRMPQEQKKLHRMDIDMSLNSILLVFAVTVVGLLGIFYVFVAPEMLPVGQSLSIVVVGVLVAVLMGFFVAAFFISPTSFAFLSFGISIIGYAVPP